MWRENKGVGNLKTSRYNISQHLCSKVWMMQNIFALMNCGKLTSSELPSQSHSSNAISHNPLSLHAQTEHPVAFFTSPTLASSLSRVHNSSSYLVVAVHCSSNLPAALGSCCCGEAVAKGEGLVAMVAGRVLERSLRGGVELQGTLGKKSRSYRQEQCMVGWEVGFELRTCVRVCMGASAWEREGAWREKLRVEEWNGEEREREQQFRADSAALCELKMAYIIY